MAHELASNALVTLVQAKAFLKITQDDQDDLITDLINRASDFVEGAQGCGRRIAYREVVTRLRPQRSQDLWLPVVPIDVEEPVLVTVDGVAQTVWRIEDDGDPANFDVIVRARSPGSPWCPDQLWRAAGWLGGSASRPDPILVEYSGGFFIDDDFGELPGDLKDAVFLVVQNLYRLQAKQLGGIATMSGGPVGSVGWEGAAASLIPMAARRTIDSYRLVSV